MRIIMVPVADRPECALALQAAFDLAERLSANIAGCHVRPHREETRLDADQRISMVLEEGALPELPQEEIKLNSANARKLFGELAERSGFRLAKKPRRSDKSLAYWHEAVGTPEKVLGIYGPVSDLIVVSRPRPGASGPARAFMLSSLFHSGKPLLVLPQERVAAPGHRVTIAWDQGVLAASTATAALPLLQRAETVNIVICGEETAPGPKTAQLGAYLRHWGIESEIHREAGHDPEDELREVYRATDSDLLVMGAYSRGRLRERILGGMTRRVLFTEDIPVFALHT